MRRSNSASPRLIVPLRTGLSGASLCLALLSACGGAAPSLGGQLHAVLAADDHRGTEEALVILRDGLASTDAGVRAAAVRALGRLERVEFAEEIATMRRADDDPSVRLAATHALAQAASASDGDAVAELLAVVLADDPESEVRGAAATGLGRLRYGNPARVAAVEQYLLAAMPSQDPALAEGVARGFAALLRGHRHLQPQPETLRLLADLSTPSRGLVDAGELGRTAATEALLTAGRLRGESLQRASKSPTAEVRRIAARAYAHDHVTAASVLFDAALRDESRLVRVEALRALRGKDNPETVCDRYQAALHDEWLPMRLAAIDAVGACANGESLLETIADGAWADQGWQPAAHALTRLARLAPTRQARRLAAAARAAPWQVRMYAANAAGETGDLDLLRELAIDAHPNVQHAALRGLQAHLGHDADDLFAAALTSPDYQVVIAAAGALAGGNGDHLVAVLDALDRITAERRETSRDPRMALLRAAATLAGDRQQEHGEHGERLLPYLADFDAAIAAAAAEAIYPAGSNADVVFEAQPLPLQPFPTLEHLREIDRTRAILTMGNGDTLTLRFFPFEAPTHAARFVRLASDGYFDGLTFHRVVYNFVLQGGSPGANEFMGDGPFTRDEITARSHRRGTVGTSTRGRDTGDGQIFINLADNLRLDFNYTIFAEVIQGEDALDNVLEGAVIESITFERDR